MPSFVLLSKLPPELTKDKGALRKASQEVTQRIKQEVPGVTWKANYCVFGPYDLVDIFEAPDAEAASKVSLIIRSVGAGTETWLAIPWEDFVKATD
jgi:uncharacterized protein with GYD domain